MQVENSIPDFREWKIPGNSQENFIPIFGNGNAYEKFHSRLSGRELEAGILGNSRDREFPLMVVQEQRKDEIRELFHLYVAHICEHILNQGSEVNPELQVTKIL